jgi:hypothetical protein
MQLYPPVWILSRTPAGRGNRRAVRPRAQHLVSDRRRRRLRDLAPLWQQRVAGDLFIDRRRKIRFVQVGEGRYAETEQEIETLLSTQ